ncbi:MAG: Fpg/Nei family DNA glycosylase [Bacillota bacterium]
MAELPEIYKFAKQLNNELAGRTIEKVQVMQEKCLNVDKSTFENQILGSRIEEVFSKGKWIYIKLDKEKWLLVNLGMGADINYNDGNKKPNGKFQFLFGLDDSTELYLRFWWFGHVHILSEKDLKEHKPTASTGLDPMDENEFNMQNFLDLLENKRGSIKAFLLDQKNIAGIGNVYIHDILFKARLHPLRKIKEMTRDEKLRLFDAIFENLHEAVKLGGIAYEKDIYGNRGKIIDFLVGYKEGLQCPNCAFEIEKIKTGGTSSYICPNCQSLP